MSDSTSSGEATRRERLLNGALALFAERGYAGTSVKAIAERAGVSQGLLYVHFANKQALLVALFERGMQDVQSTLDKSLSDSVSATEHLASLLNKTFALMQENRDFWRLFYTLRFQATALEALGPALERGLAVIREQLEEVCRDLNLPQPELEARLLFATIDGICQHATLEPETYPFKNVLDALVGKYQEVPQ